MVWTESTGVEIDSMHSVIAHVADNFKRPFSWIIDRSADEFDLHSGRIPRNVAQITQTESVYAHEVKLVAG